ncbi:8797_t:CDS:1, partial [Funneliformis geosporum]
YLISGIETNCKAFQKSLNSSSIRAIDENIDEMDIAEPSDDPNTCDEDFLLDRNIYHDNVDLLFERVINALTSA